MSSQPQRTTLGGTPSFRKHADLPTEAPVAKVGPVTPDPSIRPNKYPKPCIRCGVLVEAMQGRLEKDGERWVVSHIPPCPEVSQIVGQVEATTVEHQVNVVNGETLYDGIYTLENAEGHRTFRLRTQALDNSFMPGVQIIDYLSGSDNEGDYTGFGHVKGGRLFVWKRHQGNEPLVTDAQAFMADPQAALASTNCYRCGRTLTVPASVHDGLGPECAKRGL